MKNVTISMDERILADAKVRAAQAGKSLSRYMAELVEADVAGTRAVPGRNSSRSSQKEALERILSGPKWSILRDGRMPTADERNER
jgi:hypothetical protein